MEPLPDLVSLRMLASSSFLLGILFVLKNLLLNVLLNFRQDADQPLAEVPKLILSLQQARALVKQLFFSQKNRQQNDSLKLPGSNPFLSSIFPSKNAFEKWPG